MVNSRRLFPLILVSLIAPLLNAQVTINTTGGWDGSRQIGMFGHPSVQHTAVGQTFLAPTSAPVLNNFSFWLNAHPVFVPNIHFRAYVMAWDLDRPSGPVLWESTVSDGPTSRMQRYDFDVAGLTLAPSQEYIAFLSTAGLIAEMPSSAAVLLGYVHNPYAEGRFQSLQVVSDPDDFSERAWIRDGGCSDCDAAFVANFSSPAAVVPEPASMLLLGAGLLGVWGLSRHRRT